jgi:hypothetical protein
MREHAAARSAQSQGYNSLYQRDNGISNSPLQQVVHVSNTI